VLAVSAVVVPRSPRPPVVLVHGAANSAAVWRFWQPALADRGWSSWAVDLRGHGRSAPADLAEVAMADYADDVLEIARTLGRPPVAIGWSMGGLAALLAAAGGGVAAWVGLGPSHPARRRDPAAPVGSGTIGAEEYGIVSANPADQPTMPDLDLEERRVALASLGLESRRARDERRAGIVVAALSCPALVVAGASDAIEPPSAYEDFPLPADLTVAEGASHWGLVLSRRALAALVPTVCAWLEGRVAHSGARSATTA
jgi:pimeloyl-ACP methyl ester carboxylesterase